MADSVEISFVDEDDFVKEGKYYFLSENSQWDTMLTSGETDVHFRLKLKISQVESTYPSQLPDFPSLSPYFLLVSLHSQKLNYVTCCGLFIDM